MVETQKLYNYLLGSYTLGEIWATGLKYFGVQTASGGSKGCVILTLTSHIAIVSEGINWSGDLEKDIHKAKRVMYCKTWRTY